MKRLLALVAAMLACSALSAQTNAKSAVNYYGVDFSKTKAFGVTETGGEMKDAFVAINSLVIAEWSKYNPGRFLGLAVALRDISPTTQVNAAIDPSKVVTASSAHSLTNDEIAEMVRRYELQQTEGTGLVIIGELMDKSLARGSFRVVCFDVVSREVLQCSTLSGRARGFGLRNYWAGALYNALSRKWL